MSGFRFSRIHPRRPLSFLALLLLWSCLFLSDPALASFSATGLSPPTRPGKRAVLFLYSSDRTLLGNRMIGDALRRALLSGGVSRPEIYEEDLDLSRNAEEGHLERTAVYLERKYARKPVGLVVTIQKPAADFLLRRIRGILGEVPLVAVTNQIPALPHSAYQERVVRVVLYEEDFRNTLALVPKLFPDVKRVLAVSGSSPMDRVYDGMLRAAARDLSGIRVEHWNRLSLKEILARLPRVPEGTVILYTSMFRDAAGRQFVPREVAGEIARGASVPVLILFDTMFVGGALGGYVIPFHVVGKWAGEVGQGLLAGRGVSSWEVLRVPSVPTFDWSALERWGIPENVLPKGSVLLGRVPGFWELYGIYVLGLALMLLLQGGIILALLFQLRTRRRAERALSENRSRLELALHCAKLGAWEWNILEGICFVDDRGWRILGNQEGERFSRVESLMGMICPEDLPWFREMVGEIRSGRRDSFECSLRVRYLSGEWIRVALWGRVSEVEGGVPRKANGMIQDVTDRIRMEEQLQQARKMESVGRLAGGVAHDLNNMLLPVLGYSELLMAELPEGELREEAEEIALAGGRARDLVRQLLAFARKQPLEVRPLDLSRVVEGFSKMLRRTIRENVVLKMDLCPVLPPVEGDAGQVEQILLNLAVNAQDAMPKGGTLFIETSPIELDRGYALEHVEILPGPYVLLSVSDTGSGMGTHVREHLFDPFFTTKGTGGTGLGLATVYGIVKQHGGGIQVYSEEGRGSTFRVYFPVCREAAGVSVSEGGSPVIGGRETLLVVEDQEQVRDLTCRVLRRQGYRVLEAADGASALRLAQEFPEPIDLLATDVVMPGMNGRELYDALRLSRPGLRVLYVSGYPGNVILHHGIMEEGGDFLSKPFSLVALAAKVREVLERRGPGVGSDQGETEGVRGRTRRGGP